MSFENKVVIVTGASSGIGASTAVRFSKERAHVVLVGRNQERLNNVAALCNDPLIIKADLSDNNDVRRIVKETIDKFHKIDVLVNNAGVAHLSPIMEGEEGILKAYDYIMNTNFRAVVYLTTLVAPHLIKTKGNIVNISSVAGKKVVNGLPIYCASKAALNHFTTCAASELGGHGVRVNAISPGPTKTDIYKFFSHNPDAALEDFANMTVLKRALEPEEVAELTLYLASKKSKGITGSNLVLDGGFLIG